MNELVKLCGAIATKEELLQLLDDHAAKVRELESEKAELVAALGQVTESASDIEDMASAFIVSGDALSLENYVKNIQNTARAALAKAKGERP